MGEAELRKHNNQLIIHASIIIYGDAANDALAVQVAKDIENYWNDAAGKVRISEGWFTKRTYNVRFNIDGRFDSDLTPELVYQNLNRK